MSALDEGRFLTDAEALVEASNTFHSLAGRMDEGDVKDLYWRLAFQMRHAARAADPTGAPGLWGGGGRTSFHIHDEGGIPLCLAEDGERGTRVSVARTAWRLTRSWPSGAWKGSDTCYCSRDATSATVGAVGIVIGFRWLFTYKFSHPI